MVGISGDVQRPGQADESISNVYVPFFQDPRGGLRLFVRTDGDTEFVVPGIRAAVARVSAAAAVLDIQTLEAAFNERIAPQRAASGVVAVFGIAALLLAAAGLYGFVAYSVSVRSRELGIRRALGADNGDVAGVVFRQLSLLVVLGLALGLVGAVFLARALSGLLYGVESLDALSFAAAAALFLLTATLAGLPSVIRAVRADPLVILR